jgi:hypothetical protein
MQGRNLALVFVLTVDQKHSRRSPDRVPEALTRLGREFRPVVPFERTVGDELQGVLDDPADVVAAVLELVRWDEWYVGVGAGPVEEPLPVSTREGRGPAFVMAREAVERAKRRPSGLAVVGADAEAARSAEAVLALLATVVRRRSDAAWDAVDLVSTGLSASEAAGKLGVSRQAVGQRLAAGGYQQERDVRPVVEVLLERAGRTHHPVPA